MNALKFDAKHKKNKMNNGPTRPSTFECHATICSTRSASNFIYRCVYIFHILLYCSGKTTGVPRAPRLPTWVGRKVVYRRTYQQARTSTAVGSLKAAALFLFTNKIYLSAGFEPVPQGRGNRAAEDESASCTTTKKK